MAKVFKRILVALVILIGVGFFLRHNAFLYQHPVGQVVQVHNQKVQSITDEHNNEDQIYQQKLTIRLLNRQQKRIILTNGFNQSQTVLHRYRVGDQLILEKLSNRYHILSLKRDTVLGLLATLFILLLYFYGQRRATSWLLLSLITNIVLFIVAVGIDVQFKNPNVILIFSILAGFFALSSLLFVLGRTLQMRLTFFATLTSTALTMSIMSIVLLLTHNNGVHFETMAYVTQVPATLFIAQTIIGVLGAVMDEAADIVAGLFGMHRENAQRHFKEYWHAGMSIGRDIMGTLINVLFMIFIAETMPMVILMLRNGNNWPYILEMVMNLGILQTVVSGIGIVLAVPVTSAIVAFFLQRKVAKI